MLYKIFPCGPLETNTTIVLSPQSKTAVVFDTPLGCTPHILNTLEKQGCKLEMILLTHSHWDHIADLSKLKEKTGAPVYVHKEDAENVRLPGSDGLPLFFPIPGVEPDGFLEENQILHAGDIDIRVICTPGHTPGGVCFLIDNVLISGDTLFRGSFGNVNLPTARPEKMWESLKKLSQLPPETRVLPGHGGETTIGKEKETFE